MQPACEDPQTLKAFALGRLSEDDSQRVSRHIEECPACEETIASMDDTADSLVKGVRSATENENSQLLESALRRIANPFGTDSGETDAQMPTQMVREYELLEELGRGGMGAVYRARHTRLNRIVALKLLPSRRLRNDAAVQRFEREMMAIGQLRHPSIVQATDADEVAGTHFLAMELIEGVDASRLVKHHGPLSVSAACEIIRQCALALEYAHGEGLIHRDIKPGNIMVSPQCGEGQVKLLDLGLALFGSASEAVDNLTTVGQLMGTLDYMAPEQADSSHDVTEAADIYSLGATLYKLLTGTAPYETDAYRTPMQKMRALSLVEPDSVASRRDDLPPELVGLVDRMLSRDAAKAAPEDLPHLPATGDVLPHFQSSAGGRDWTEPAKEAPEGRAETAPGLRSSLATTPATRATANVGKLLAGLAALIIAAVVYRIETDNGTLIIECSSDQIPVQIRSGREVVESMTLLSGQNRVTLRSGQYEVVIPASYDQLKMANDSVEIRRGEETVARVSEVPDSALPSGATSRLVGKDETGSADLEATFEDRTFDEWQAVARTERSEEQLSKAIKAVVALAPGTKLIPDRTADALETVFEVIRQRPVYSAASHIANGPIWETVLRSGLADFNTESLLEYFIERLSEADLSKPEEHLIARFWASHFHIDVTGDSRPAGEIVLDPASMTAELDASESFREAVAMRFGEADEFLQLAWLDSLQRRIDEQKHRITREERELLADSLGGEFGLLVQQLARQIKRDLLKEMDADLASALLDQIENDDTQLRVHGIYDVYTWGPNCTVGSSSSHWLQ